MVPFLEKPQLLDGIIKPYIAMIMNQIQVQRMPFS